MNSPAEAGSPASAVPETSEDAFYGGRFRLVQPKGRGFRAGLDALLLAASLPQDREGRAADLGAGAGAASLAVAVRCPALRIALLENDPVMAGLARLSLALPINAGLAERLRVVEADVLARRPERAAAGLDDGAFGTVFTNPPFHPETGRPSPDRLRDAARAMPDRDFLPAWIRAAAVLLQTGGLFAMIARPDNLEAVLGSAANRFGDLRIMPVHARPDRPAIRMLVHARKGSRARPAILMPCVLRDLDGELTEIGHAVGSGAARIDLGLG